MMTRMQYFFGCLAEEAAEVGQRASKAQRFGAYEVQPGQHATNAERLTFEMNDLLAVLDILREEGIRFEGIGDEKAIEKKKAKLRRYMEYSATVGLVSIERSGE